MLQIFVLRLFTGKIWDRYRKEGIVSICRETQESLGKSVIRDFEDILQKNGLMGAVKRNIQKKTYRFGGRTVEFIWANDYQRLKGTKRNILYGNESDELDYKTQFFQLLIRTSDFVILDFNPDDPDVWINTEIEQKRALEKWDVEVIVTTYKDNPFLSKAEIDEIENIINIDPVLWNVYGKWEYGRIDGLIFDWRGSIETVPEDAEYIGTGIDFWFSNDPAAVVDLWRRNKQLIVDERVYAKGLTNLDLSDEMEEDGMDKDLADIVADSAEPKSIEDLERYGRYVKGAYKGKDSVRHWLLFMKQFKRLVTARSLNTKKEFRKYTWKLDKTGNATKKPIDKRNHSIDALRYITTDKLMDWDDDVDLYNDDIYILN